MPAGSNSLILAVLDVGHGNCALVMGPNESVVIDCAPGIVLSEAISNFGISKIDAIFLSHADADHIGGAVNILLDKNITVKRIYVNPDASKDTRIWHQLRIAVSDARRRSELEVRTELTSEVNEEYVGYSVEILAPSPEIAMAGPGGKDLEDRKLTSNSVSAVIAIRRKERITAIFGGDIDYVGLENMLDNIDETEVDVLIFPHHGANPTGITAEQFTQMITKAIKPRMIIFSFSRSRHNYPSIEIIDALKKSSPQSHILCTQLSKHCSQDSQAINSHRLPPQSSAGLSNGICCGGSTILSYEEDISTLDMVLETHDKFIVEEVESPICKS